jgi:hypothetical protein
MDEHEILTCIRQLIAEEHRLRAGHQGAPWTPDELERLHEVERSLDDLWTALRACRRAAAAGPVSGATAPAA